MLSVLYTQALSLLCSGITLLIMWKTHVPRCENESARVRFMQSKTHKQSHECDLCKMAKRTSAFCVKQMHMRCSCKNDSYDRRITSQVYTHALDVHVYVVDLSCTHSQYHQCFLKCVEPCICHTSV